MSPTIPITLLSGYLGAGKTTILNHVLSTDHGLRVTVLVNDFGKINIDAGLIKNATGDTIELTNGCVCCTVGDDLGAALTALNETLPRPDHVLIEASGVTNPARVAMHSGHWPGFHLCRIIVAADAETVIRRSQDKYVGALIETQIAAANIIVLTKPDLVGKEVASETCVWLTKRNPQASIFQAIHGTLPTGMFFENHSPVFPHLAQADGLSPGVFDSALWCPTRPVDLRKMGAIIEAMPLSIQRVKGTVIDRNTKAAVLVQAVGNRFQTTAGSPQARLGLAVISRGDPEAAKWLSTLLDTC